MDRRSYQRGRLGRVRVSRVNGALCSAAHKNHYQVHQKPPPGPPPGPPQKSPGPQQKLQRRQDKSDPQKRLSTKKTCTRSRWAWRWTAFLDRRVELRPPAHGHGQLRGQVLGLEESLKAHSQLGGGHGLKLEPISLARRQLTGAQILEIRCFYRCFYRKAK